jgi:hypothetical protein
MAFTQQNDNGSIDDANAYIDATYFKAYHKDRNNDIGGAGGGDIQKAIVTATDYLDSRFTFVGERARVAQRTAWPRTGAEDVDGHLRSGIPNEVQEACADYALIALDQDLNPTPTRDASGRSVEVRSEKAGPLSRTYQYSKSSTYTLPKYPKADRKLQAAGLVISGRDVRRA